VTLIGDREIISFRNRRIVASIYSGQPFEFLGCLTYIKEIDPCNSNDATPLSYLDIAQSIEHEGAFVIEMFIDQREGYWLTKWRPVRTIISLGEQG
jgi:hypothetical protein